jgi:hypothetical protein
LLDEPRSEDESWTHSADDGLVPQEAIHGLQRHRKCRNRSILLQLDRFLDSCAKKAGYIGSPVIGLLQ